MNIPQPFPYQGSKRKIAPAIMASLPQNTATLIEPFAGSGALSIAAAHGGKALRFVLNDINAPLMALWEKIIDQPAALALQYEGLWKAQQGREKEYYFYIRDEFNRTHGPHYLLYLLARCVKAAIRYNRRGEFNQSPDNRRKGMRPGSMQENILRTSQLLHGKTAISALDYREVLCSVQPLDVVYMDPPYQGVCKKQDPRYVQGLSFETLTAALQDLNAKNVSYIISYDGRTGSKAHGKPLPESLELLHLEIDAGRSTQDTLLGRNGVTYESLYLSPALSARLENESAALRQLAFGF
jgi:DNA adenine methylase